MSTVMQRLARRMATVCLLSLAVLPGSLADSGRSIKSKTDPVYPVIARKMNISGTVKLQLVVEPNGMVKTVKPLGGHPLLIDSAVAAVKEWKYAPAADETVETVSIVFKDAN